MSEYLDYIGSVEFQAAYTIWEKYKRSLELGVKDLHRLEVVSYYLSEERKQKGKIPNVDFLTQEVGKFLKGDYNQQTELNRKVQDLIDFKNNE